MSASYEEVGALLVRWKEAGQPVTILFSSEAANWRRPGKISYVYFGKFDVEWNDDGSDPNNMLMPQFLVGEGIFGNATDLAS